MSIETPVDPAALREEVKSKYREVALNPHGEFHFHTGRPLAARLGYDTPAVDALPDAAVESFAGVANPFSLRPLQPARGLSMSAPAAGLTVSSLPARSARRAAWSASI